MNKSPLTRRQFLAGAAGLTGMLALGDPIYPLARAQSEAAMPAPAFSGIEHIVVVMMENRSFDHLLGWVPGADGKQAGLVYTDKSGMPHPTHPLAPDYQGCGFADPDHSYQGGRVEYDSGRCDGWLRANDVYSIGYYTRSDLAFLGRAATDWTTCDRYFAAIMAPTLPNRFEQHAAQTDRIQTTLAISALPTIWDRLAEKGISGHYYFSDLPVLALWGAKYLPIARPILQFLIDCAAGTLPQVSFVDPSFLGNTADDDHPHADIRNGEVFLNLIYTAVTRGPGWANTLLVINFDEWGGFFDHVPPPKSPVPLFEYFAGNQDGLRGFRTPALLISPWSRRGFVSHAIFDHTSVLKTIEWRWGLQPLTVRDAFANNLAAVLDFSRPNLTAPQYLVPPGPFSGACPATAAPSTASAPPHPSENWAALADLARKYGWQVS